jgi:hypothetical protein
MRYISKKWFLLGVTLALGGGVFIMHGKTAAAAQGLTVTPATSTLSLGKDEPEQRSTTTITNNYPAPISLHFAFAPRQDTTARDRLATEALSAAITDRTLAPGESMTQTIILRASDKLAPGSQQADIVISQTAVAGTNIGVLPELRLPLILVKEDGAIARLGLTGIEHAAIGLTIPKTINATLKNTGNMLVIPRGFVTVTAPGGKTVAKGTLNTASMALSPGTNQRFATAITPLSSAVLPGPYTVHVSYGLGGDQAAKNGRAGFFYIAWWHGLVLFALIGLAYYLTHHAIPTYIYRRRKTRAPPGKKTALVGRDTL